MPIPTIPAFRFGEHYDSLTVSQLRTPASGEVLARVGLVNPGLIRRDLRRIADCFDRLQQVPVQRMLDICAKAARLFLEAELPVSKDTTQKPEDYVRHLSATGGLPYALIRANMNKIADVLSNMAVIVNGLTRGLGLDAIETGSGFQDGVPVSYYPNTTHLGAVLPSNSPGVHSLWLPALALRIPVVLKPGREDPWTPWRIINALLAAGCPAEAFGFYPADHDGAGVILSDCTRVVLFGDARTVARYEGDPRISVHGPGFSKVLIGDDQIDRWPELVDVLVDSIARNGGRSCVNASTVVVPRHGAELSEALAKRLVRVTPRPLAAPDAELAGFADARVAEGIDRKIEAALERPGAVDVSAQRRGSPRLCTCDGQAYLQPTIVYCDDPEHPLGRTEFPFPFAAVIERSQNEMLAWIGSSLVVTAITDDPSFRKQLLRCRDVQRFNLGPIPTGQVRWDQPHEGNLFEFLYARRAIQEQVACV